MQMALPPTRKDQTNAGGGQPHGSLAQMALMPARPCSQGCWGSVATLPRYVGTRQRVSDFLGDIPPHIGSSFQVSC